MRAEYLYYNKCLERYCTGWQIQTLLLALLAQSVLFYGKEAVFKMFRSKAEWLNWKKIFTAGCAELAHQLICVNRTRCEWTDLWESVKVKNAVAQIRIWSATEAVIKSPKWCSQIESDNLLNKTIEMVDMLRANRLSSFIHDFTFMGTEPHELY